MHANPVTVHDVDLPEGRIRYLRAGTSGPAVLLLHGSMLDTAKLAWGRVMPALAGSFQVFAPDWPRHGGSRPWRGAADQPALEQCLDRLLDHWGLPCASLVGHSMGGGVAAGYAITRPERVQRLVLVAPGAIEDERVAQRTVYLLFQSPRALRWMTAWYARSPKRVRSATLAGLVDGEKNPDAEELSALAQEEMLAKQAAGDLIFDEWQIGSFGWDRMRLNHRPRLPEITAPTLLVHGREDTLVPVACMEDAARLIPGAKLLRVERAGHWVPRDRPEAFNAALLSFLQPLLG
ncbi:alpha/beta fold hydrolase [Chondromyces crocatus]|uniref:Alpha/beta hydrolase n=1 Tax=Chondromyces crocatus TaxID=52 RepID=A0A0K1EHA8_CHOCO|nr:alpha/beta hydrolase [Chondromyces crocatus]AKT40250.1 alpha/beta hydrolase [Chondromyces crocatus]